MERLLTLAAVIAGVVAWGLFYRADLVLSHYDAKAHLVVARRVFDGLTPGWQQVGAVWLPLPHLLLLLPVQVDVLYRTGLAGSLISIASFGGLVYAATRLVRRLTDSTLGAVVAAALLVANPNVLYLQATPMTEPLLLALTTLLVLRLVEWWQAGGDDAPRVGWLLFLAAWTRFEAWPLIGALVGIVLVVSLRSGVRGARLVRLAWPLVAWPAAAVVLFLVNSRLTVGRWFVSDGFFVPDPTYAHRPVRTLGALVAGTSGLSDPLMVSVALVTAGLVLLRLFRHRDRPSLAPLLPLALFATAAVPFVAFIDGHPYRIRYMVPLVSACAVWCGLAVGLLPRRLAWGTAVALAAAALWVSPPWRATAPMLLEAQWDRPASRGRQAVSACLARDYDGEKVLASMGSLAHYMQELSRERFALRDFIHEGTGVIWNAAMVSGPAPHAGWMLVEEVAEGGDVLADRIRREPAFADGMQRVCSGGGVALYRRVTATVAADAPR